MTTDKTPAGTAELIAHVDEYGECDCGIEQVTPAQAQLLALFDDWRGDKSYRDHDEVVKWADKLTEPLLALASMCSCATTHATYEGPEADCPVHGAVRALAEVTRERDEWKRKATDAAATLGFNRTATKAAGEEVARLRAELAEAKAAILELGDDIMRANGWEPQNGVTVELSSALERLVLQRDLLRENRDQYRRNWDIVRVQAEQAPAAMRERAADYFARCAEAKRREAAASGESIRATETIMAITWEMTAEYLREPTIWEEGDAIPAAVPQDGDYRALLADALLLDAKSVILKATRAHCADDPWRKDASRWVQQYAAFTGEEDAAAPQADPYPLVSQDFRDAVAKTAAERWPDKYGAAPQADEPTFKRRCAYEPGCDGTPLPFDLACDRHPACAECGGRIMHELSCRTARAERLAARAAEKAAVPGDGEQAAATTGESAA